MHDLKKPSGRLIYTSKKERIHGSADDIIRFKEAQYKYRIKLMVIGVIASSLAAALKYYLFKSG